MAKITTKAALVLGTNLKLHVADKSGTDITIGVAGTILTLTSTVTDFVSNSETAGIVNRPLIINDLIVLSHTNNDLNEGLLAEISAVSAHSITATITSGPTIPGANEIAGADINVVGLKKTYEFLEAGGLSFVDGVQGITFVSKMADLWDTTDLDRYDPAFASIEPRAKAVASINYWEGHNLQTLNAIRDTALEYRYSKTSSAHTIFTLFSSSGISHATTDQVTTWSEDDLEMDAPQSFVMTGYVNQLIKIYDQRAGLDKRGIWFTRLAVEGKTIIMEQHSCNFAEIKTISVANGIDPKLTVNDATVSAGGIYSNIDFNLDIDSSYSGDVNGTPYNFYGFIEGDEQYNETVHQKINYLWRQPININSDGSGPQKRGDKQWPITSFSGEDFTVKSYLSNYNDSQRNKIFLLDLTATIRTWPAIYTITVTSPDLAVGGRMSIIHKDTHGTSSPVYLKNEDNIDQKDITIAATQDIVVAYSTYNINGHTPNTPIELVLTWNKPDTVEPDNKTFILGQSNRIESITPTANPSYTPI